MMTLAEVDRQPIADLARYGLTGQLVSALEEHHFIWVRDLRVRVRDLTELVTYRGITRQSALDICSALLRFVQACQSGEHAAWIRRCDREREEHRAQAMQAPIPKFPRSPGNVSRHLRVLRKQQQETAE